MRWLIVLLMAMLAWTIAGAYPTLTGPTGLIALPTGEYLVPGIHAAIDTQDQRADRAIPIRAQLVFGPSIEVGALFNPFSTDAALDTAIGANVKIIAGMPDGFNIGVGAQVLRLTDFSDSDIDFLQVYAAWTTDFNPEYFDASNVTITLGANWTQVDYPGPWQEDAIRGFAGFAVRMTDHITLVGEYQMKTAALGDLEPLSSLGLRLNLGDSLHLQGGITNAQGLLGGYNHNLFLGASLLFANPGDE